MKNLYILRHAKTNQISKTGRDFDRALLPKGDEQIKALRQYFTNFPLEQNTEAWVSTSKRTRQTYSGVEKELNLSKTTFFDELYLPSHKEILNQLWAFESSNNLLLVGHNFGISDLVSYFTEKDVELATGEFIHLQFACDSWQETSRGLATIVARFRPLKDLLP